MRLRKLIILLLMLCLCQITPGAGDPIAGKQKSRFCAQCHGVTGHSVDQNVPKLSGQLANYIVTEIVEFQQGIRTDPLMDNVASLIENQQDLEDIAAYFSAQTAMTGQPTNSELAVEGETLFTTERCNYCHGEGGKRYAPFEDRSAPVIGGQHKNYLIKALNDIRDNRRPGDIYNLMIKLLAPLNEKQIEAIAEYLSGL